MSSHVAGSSREIGRCVKCGSVVEDRNPYPWCIKCGEPLPPEIQRQLVIWPTLGAGTAERAGAGLCSRCRTNPLVEVKSRRFSRATPLTSAAIAGVLFVLVGVTAQLTGPFSPEFARLFGNVEAILVGAAAATWFWKKTEWKCPICDIAPTTQQSARVSDDGEAGVQQKGPSSIVEPAISKGSPEVPPSSSIRAKRTVQLNGWQRLWVVLSVLWTLWVGFRTWQDWPTDWFAANAPPTLSVVNSEPLPDPVAILSKLPAEQRSPAWQSIASAQDPASLEKALLALALTDEDRSALWQLRAASESAKPIRVQTHRGVVEFPAGTTQDEMKAALRMLPTEPLNPLMAQQPIDYAALAKQYGGTVVEPPAPSATEPSARSMPGEGPVVIVAPNGTEHEFPPGMDPKRAAAIVRSRLGLPAPVHTGKPAAVEDLVAKQPPAPTSFAADPYALRARKELRAKQVGVLVWAVVLWLLPLVAVYWLGWATAWVYRGFTRAAR
jgi:hypothetical protein